MRQLTRTPNFPKFKREWSWVETEGVESVVSQWLKVRGIKKDSSSYYGMPYTSSSSYAMAGNTNEGKEKFKLPFNGVIKDFRVSHFALTAQECSMLVVVFMDEEENELYFELTSDDYQG